MLTIVFIHDCYALSSGIRMVYFDSFDLHVHLGFKVSNNISDVCTCILSVVEIWGS